MPDLLPTHELVDCKSIHLLDGFILGVDESEEGPIVGGFYVPPALGEPFATLLPI